MIRSMRMRRFVTGVSIVMLLLCQTAAVARASAATALSLAPSTEVDTTSPCHHDVTEVNGNAPAHSCQDRCPSRDASFETAKINIPSVESLWLPVFTVDLLDAAPAVALPYERIVTNAAPPPRLLVCCRLLI
jgi:hypothetical protein